MACDHDFLFCCCRSVFIWVPVDRSLDYHSPSTRYSQNFSFCIGNLLNEFRCCRQPLANRAYIKHHGLRSTVAFVLAKLADIQVGYSNRFISLIRKFQSLFYLARWRCARPLLRMWNLADRSIQILACRLTWSWLYIFLVQVITLAN